MATTVLAGVRNNLSPLLRLQKETGHFHFYILPEGKKKGKVVPVLN
jgi:hypothetical protein